MIVQRCDNCKKQIEGLDSFKLGKNYGGVDLCEACAAPIVRLVIEKKLLKPKPAKELQTGSLQNREV